MPKKTKNIEDPTIKAFITTFLSIIGFIIAIIFWKDNKYVKFYAKQSLVVFIFALIVGIIEWVFLLIPIIGWLIVILLNVSVIALWVFSWVYALSGKKTQVPYIGKYASNF